MGSGRIISEARADLHGVRAARTVVRMQVDCGRVRSLAGIEEFIALQSLILERPGTAHLEPLGALPGLRQLELLTADADLSPLRRLRGLETLVLARLSPHADETLDALPVRDLRRLRMLEIDFDPPLVVPAALPWLPHPALEQLHIIDAPLTDDALRRVLTSPDRLDRFVFTPASEAQIELTRDARAGLSIGWTESPWGPPHAPTRHTRRVDLVDLWGAESNPEAALELERMLAAEAPELLPLVRIDADGSYVWLDSSEAHALERVVEFALAKRPGPPAR